MPVQTNISWLHKQDNGLGTASNCGMLHYLISKPVLYDEVIDSHTVNSVQIHRKQLLPLMTINTQPLVDKEWDLSLIPEKMFSVLTSPAKGAQGWY